MKTESPTLIGQREICHEEKEGADTDLKFSSWFSVLVWACLFVGFVFTDSYLGWDPFLVSTPKMGLINCHVLTSLLLVFILHLYLFVSGWLLPCVGWRTLSISCGSTPVQKIWDFFFPSLSFLITVFTHDWLTYNQFFSLGHSALSPYFFFSISPFQKLASSLYNLNLPYHVTLFSNLKQKRTHY